MSKFRVNIAKEKISRLKEKYSKSVKEDTTSSSESIISINYNESAEQKKKHFQEKNSNSETPVRTDNTPTSKMKDDLHIFKADLRSFDEIISPRSKTDIAEELSFEKPLSTGSLTLTDLSNQFERIHFISSSSEDLSIVESENSQSKSISTDIIPSVKSLESNKNISEYINTQVEKELFIMPDGDDYIKTFNKTGENISLKSFQEPETSVSTILSIKELKSSSGPEGLSSINKNNNEKVNSITRPLQYNEIIDVEKSSTINSFSSVVEKESLKNITVFKENEISSTMDKYSDCFQSPKSSKSDKKMLSGGKEKTDFLEKLSLKKISPKHHNENETLKSTKCIDYVNKSINTDPVKVILLKNWSKRNKRKYVKVEKSKETSKLGGHHYLNTKQHSKRAFVKPCRLIRRDDIEKLESKGVLHKELQSLRYKYIDDIYSSCNPAVTLENNCEEVISQLLKNQIMLTRHFIECHQQMYLQVCRAAQLLNENYSQSP